MSENRESNPYSKQYGEDRKSWPPEVFLAVLVHELRNPIAVVKGWTQFLSNENTKEHFSQGIEIISQKIGILEKLHEGVEEYLDGHMQKPGT